MRESRGLTHIMATTRSLNWNIHCTHTSQAYVRIFHSREPVASMHFILGTCKKQPSSACLSFEPSRTLEATCMTYKPCRMHVVNNRIINLYGVSAKSKFNLGCRDQTCLHWASRKKESGVKRNELKSRRNYWDLAQKISGLLGLLFQKKDLGGSKKRSRDPEIR